MILKDILKDIKPRQIISSRGTPTVEIEFCLDGFSIFSSVPSGKSVGSLEAKIIVDNGDSYSGTSVSTVVNSIIQHKNILLELEVSSPDIFDAFLITLDGTRDKSKLGTNFILPLSICYRKLFAYINKEPLWAQFVKKRLNIMNMLSKESEARAFQTDNQNLKKEKDQDMLKQSSTDKIKTGSDFYCLNCNFNSQMEGNLTVRMPLAHFNVINGGLHSGNKLDCQEIMVCFEESTFKLQLEKSIQFYEALGKEISEKYNKIYTSVGDEGGYVPPIETLVEALNLIVSTGEKIPNLKYKIALDLAASSFHLEENLYFFENKKITGKELALYYEDLVVKYPIYSIEDPFDETDYDSWIYFYEKMNEKINIVADDLTVTNPELIEKLGKRGMFNTVLIKPNQIGSIMETVNAVDLCQKMGFKVMISHRSSETEDTFISDFAVGVGAEYIKSGAPSHGERICKYNELLRIEETIIDQFKL